MTAVTRINQTVNKSEHLKNPAKLNSQKGNKEFPQRSLVIEQGTRSKIPSLHMVANYPFLLEQDTHFIDMLSVIFHVRIRIRNWNSGLILIPLCYPLP